MDMPSAEQGWDSRDGCSVFVGPAIAPTILAQLSLRAIYALHTPLEQPHPLPQQDQYG